MTDPRPFCLSCALLMTACAGHAAEIEPPATAAVAPSPPRPAPLPVLDAEPNIRVLIAEGAAALTVSAAELPGQLDRIGEDEATLAILTLPMETYLRGVVSAEIPARWGVEEKKAQAIAARSYAIAHLGRGEPYDLMSTTLDQVYRPHENVGAAEAVEATRGLVLVDESTRALVEAFYHSTCGGHTENALDVWPEAPPYTWSTSCRTCAASPRYRWEVRVSNGTIAGAFPAIDELDALRLDERAESGRVLRVTLVEGGVEHAMGAPEFRRAIGTSTLRSAFFETEESDEAIVFRGRGFGHGVGMCQWGAHGLVAEGAGHREVLSHYYRGTRVHRLYE